MFASTPAINTYFDAIDELDDVRCDLAGLAQIVLALEIAGIAESESLGLVASLLDHCSLCLETAIAFFETEAA